MPNKVQNKEHYLNIAQNLDNIANLFRQLTNGKVTLTHVAKTLNMKASQLGPAIFNDSLLQSKLKLKEDSLKIIKLSMSPHEQLIADIFGIRIKDIVVTVSKSQENDINDIILKSLTNKQIYIITALYGLNGKDPFTLSQTANNINISKERVRQIKEKAIRILRYRLTIFYNYPHEIDLNPDSYIGHIRILEKKIIHLDKKLSDAELKVIELQNQLQKNMNDDTIPKFQSIDISRLNLSVRAYNSLKRAGINTLLDIALLDEIKIRTIRNLGEKSIIEIKNILKSYGFELGQLKKSINTK